MKKIALILSFLVFTGVCQAKVYFTNKSDHDVQVIFKSTDNTFIGRDKPIVHPNDTLETNKVLDWVSDITVSEPTRDPNIKTPQFGAKKLVGRTAYKSEGGWPAPKNTVTFIEEVDKSTGKKTPKILVNDE
jgi:hypothetical protein